MNNTTITDTYGDSLSLNADGEEGMLYLQFKCDDCTMLEFEKKQAEQLRNALDEFVGDQPITNDPNEAKLRLAVGYDFKAKFAYKGERDYRAETRRLEPSEVYDNDGVMYVGGMSYDDGGNAEGYRQFRLDRISGAVTIR
jgi:predicted DNA-binding transcriptional regulator YafY